MGWMTLHSISVCYPNNPDQNDKAIVRTFLELFRDSITCPTCKQHFTSIFATYTIMHPDWANSKFDLFVMICRLHNTVNKRLDKPSPATVDDAIKTLIAATSVTSPSIFRRNYIQYVINNFSAYHSGEGIIFANSARQMMRINNEYWSTREVAYSSLSFPEANLLELVPENPEMYNLRNGMRPFIPSSLRNVGFSLRGGRLTLARR
jgi:hypothetical protein